MSTGLILTTIIGAAMALAINWRAMRGHGLGASTTVKMALIWIAIIAGLTLLISLVKG